MKYPGDILDKKAREALARIKLSIYKVPTGSRAWFSPKRGPTHQVVAILPKYGKCIFAGNKTECKRFIREVKDNG